MKSLSPQLCSSHLSWTFFVALNNATSSLDWYFSLILNSKKNVPKHSDSTAPVYEE